MNQNEILKSITSEEHEALYASIVEVDACKQLHEENMRAVDCNPLAIKIEMDYYMHVLKEHKALWRSILLNYFDVDFVSENYNLLRYDPMKRVIFKQFVEGCPLCK